MKERSPLSRWGNTEPGTGCQKWPLIDIVLVLGHQIVFDPRAIPRVGVFKALQHDQLEQTDTASVSDVLMLSIFTLAGEQTMRLHLEVPD